MAQAIGQLIEIFGLAAFAALATAFCLTWLGQRFLPAGLASRIVLPCAVTIAYLAGYALLPRSFALFTPQPARLWPWLPYLALIGTAVSAAIPQSSRYLIRFIALIATCALAAILLTPNWSVYGFTRAPLAIFLTIYLLAVGLPLVFSQPPQLTRPALYFLVAIGILNTLAIGAVYSARHAQLSALSATALTGISLALLFGSKVPELALWRLATLFVTLVGGIAWLACVEPDPPKPILLVIPLLAWAIWVPVAAGRLPSAAKRIG